MTSPPSTRYSTTLTTTPPGCAPFCPARFIRARYLPSSRTCTGRRATLDRARISRCASACVYAFHSTTPGKPRSMITSIPAALPAIAIASAGSPPLPGPGERGPVPNRLVHPLQRPHQVLRDIVIGILLEQGKSEHVVDHEPGRKRPGLLVPLAALSQDLIHQAGGHPLGEHTQPHVIR